MRPRRWSRGQIVIPSLFVIPSLMLFVYLIYETAKLSREKIRHQFAVDSAAFVEMTNYADFLNRTAYVNGAFPQRIFAEGFADDPQIPKKSDDSQKETLYEILWENGAFPRKGGKSKSEALAPLDDVDTWDIRYYDNIQVDGTSGTHEPEAGDYNSPTPKVPSTFHLITQQNAIDYYISWEDAQDIYKLYVQIYQLLGSVVDAQYSVFKRLTGGGNPHTFFRKSYWLNTGDNVNDPVEGASYFSKHAFVPHAECIQKLVIHGNKPTSDPYQPYRIVRPKDDIVMPKTVNSDLCSQDGLFQMAWVPQGDMSDLMGNTMNGVSNYPGYAVVQHWNPPTNYFKVFFSDVCDLPGGGGPCVHSTISLTGSGHVWPDPTPKFQTRLYP